ncbi:MAG: hypothetical protein FJ267_20110, partial [Planctomycetes bacterium]|nr:hypothetical protein [Planctomycetota bacterium]
NEIEQTLEQLTSDGSIPETDPALKSIRIQFEKARGLHAKASGKGTVSFVKDIAPILTKRCVQCHDETAKGGLKLDTFAGLEQGGTSGKVLNSGNAQSSLLMQRIVTPNPQFRMPKGGQGLSAKEIQAIGVWINEGAGFDGGEKTAELSTLSRKPTKLAPKIIIAKPTGDETVSFVKDIAPALVNICSGCHNDSQKRGGLSMATFEKLMRGGEGGRVIVPEKVDESRLFELLKSGDMPRGQARIERKWYADLQTWIREGAKFDGPDPSKPLRDLVPTDDMIEAEKLAKLTPAEFAAKRLADSMEQWKKTFPSSEPVCVEGSEFLVLGDSDETRLKQIEDWAK